MTRDKQLLPTEAMIEAGADEYDAWVENRPRYPADLAKRMWLRMEAARPSLGEGVDGHRLLAVLGFYRDQMPPEAVKAFQEVLAPTILAMQSKEPK